MSNRLVSPKIMVANSREQLWLAILLAFGLVLRIALFLQPLPAMLERTLPDDAFYYFVIARNAAQGAGFSFDGVAPTNGFHPLWAVALMPIFWVFQGGSMAVKAALLLGAALDVAAGGILARLAARSVPRSGLFAAGLYLFNPRIAMEAVNGLETSLGMLTLTAFLWAGSKVLDQDSHARWAGLGFTAGLAFLARTDLAIVMAAVVVGLIWTKWNQGIGLPVYGVSLAGLAGMFTIAPWMIWNLARFGTVVQSSAVAVPLLAQALIAQGGEVWEGLLWPVLNYSLRLSLIYPGLGLISICLGLIILRLRKSIEYPQRNGHPRARKANSFGDVPGTALFHWAPVLGAAALIVVHTTVRWYPRGWYFVPLAGTAAFSGGMLITRAAAGMARRGQAALGLLMALILAAQVLRTVGEITYPGQGNMLEAAEWARESTPREAVIGSFNSGILGYFSERQVVNLDGVVDWGAIEARGEKRVLGYLIQRGGTLLIDHEAYIWNSYRPFLGAEWERLREAKSFGERNAVYGAVIVYEIGQ